MIQICVVTLSRGSIMSTSCYRHNLCRWLCSQCFSVPLAQMYTLCIYTLGHNHKDCSCVCVCDCEIFLAFLFVLPVSGADIDRGGDDRLYAMRLFACFCTADRYRPEKWSHVLLFISFRFWSYRLSFDPSCVFMCVLSFKKNHVPCKSCIVNIDFSILSTANFVNKGNSFNEEI